jgi:enoyl-CoA hydratase
VSKWLKSPQTLLFEVRDAIAYVTFNRPDKRNALSFKAMEELNAAMMEADDLKSVRVVVLSGNGKDFCAGADVASGALSTELAELGYDPANYRARDNFEDDTWLTELGSNLRLIIHNMHKPVIAKVHGNCLAVGSDIALNCDMVIIAEDARIGFPATRSIGSPANHMWLYLVGPQWAKRMLMTGDTLSGRDAARLGLALDAYPADRLDEEVERLAKRIAIMPSDLQAAHKRIVNLGLELMGWSTMQRLAAENDCRAHLSSAFGNFFSESERVGFKEALSQRDTPYGDRTGDHRVDSVIKVNVLDAGSDGAR